MDRGPGRCWAGSSTCCGLGALAAAAGQGAGLWQRRDLLAAAARLASRRRLGGLALSAAGLAGRRRPGRLVQGGDRQRERAGPPWGDLVGANPVDRGNPGSKYHLLVDATGIPLAVGLSAANTHDSQLLEDVVDAVPAVIGPRGRPGRPRKRPAKLHADKGYDYPTCRRALRRRGTCPRIARRGVESNTRLGRHRWKVERSLAWLLGNRRLTVRYERRADLLQAFLHLACALICARKLHPL
jgi:IS5 family transposase